MHNKFQHLSHNRIISAADDYFSSSNLHLRSRSQSPNKLAVQAGLTVNSSQLTKGMEQKRRVGVVFKIVLYQNKSIFRTLTCLTPWSPPMDSRTLDRIWEAWTAMRPGRARKRWTNWLLLGASNKEYLYQIFLMINTTFQTAPIERESTKIFRQFDGVQLSSWGGF